MKLILFTILLSSLAIARAFAGADYSVTVRDDNDIATYKDSVSKQMAAPTAVNKKLKDFLVQKLMDGELDAVQMYKYLQTFRITTPDSNYVFVTEIDEGPRGLQFYVFYYNVKFDVCSDYINVDGYFMKNNEEGFKDWDGKMVDKPYISFMDVNNDGASEIIFNRRAHNGTWNAVQTIAMKIGGTKPEILFSFFAKELRGSDPEILIKRTFKYFEKNVLCTSAAEYDFKTGKLTRELNDELHPPIKKEN